MIRFEVSELSSTPYYNITGAQIATYGNGATEGSQYADLKKATILLSATGGDVVYWERAVGSKPVHGSKVYGTMRDKEVSHLNAQGTIRLMDHTLVTGTSLHGIPTVTKASNGLVLTADHPHSWGEEVGQSHTVPGYRYYISSYSEWRYVLPSTGVWSLRWDGDKALFISEIHNGAVFRERDDYQRVAASDMYAIQKLSRRNGLIYSHGSVTRTGQSYSGTEQLSLLAGIDVNTGTLVSTSGPFVSIDLGIDESHIDALSEDIRHHISRAHLHLDEHPVDFGELALDVSKQLKFVDQNVLLLVFDVDDWRNFHRLWKNLRNSDGWSAAMRAFKRASRGKGKLVDFIDLFRPASSTYLFAKYAVLPSVSDVRRLVEGAGRFSAYQTRQRLHARKVTSIDDPSAVYAQHAAVITVQCSVYPSWFTGKLQELISYSKRWGVFPGVQNLWDMLPYSFVVDWFVQFGDLFEDVDAYLDQKYYFPVQYCVCSEKWSVSKSITSIQPGTQASGEVTFSYYTRWITKELPLPVVSLEAESTVGNHLLESTALVLQRL